ncbi:WFDC1 isoform 5 [Pongo abelii]|uniref:WFDC1 isoform 5 n=1 Tax=Pongo abelii TaxID=9601 RepID=A0A2J8T9P1_PONAB|nr:WFDC1 isoform 5 [Pongo abelii]
MPLTSVGPGSRRRQIIRALCLLLLLHAGSAKNTWKRALPARLAEKSRVSAWDGEAGAASVGGRQP